MTWDSFTIFLVNSSTGLALGLSISVLRDFLSPWWKRHAWLIVIALGAIWLPFSTETNAPLRRINNTAVGIYLCVLFILHSMKYNRRHNKEMEEK